MNPQNDFKSVLTDVIKKQMIVLGPDITLAKVREISGISIMDDGTVSDVVGDPKMITQQLIDSFTQLAGSVEQKAMEPLIAFTQVPSITSPSTGSVQAGQLSSTQTPPETSGSIPPLSIKPEILADQTLNPNPLTDSKAISSATTVSATPEPTTTLDTSTNPIGSATPTVPPVQPEIQPAQMPVASESSAEVDNSIQPQSQEQSPTQTQDTSASVNSGQSSSQDLAQATTVPPTTSIPTPDVSASTSPTPSTATTTDTLATPQPTTDPTKTQV